jgi:diaminopimelate epimerase
VAALTGAESPIRVLVKGGDTLSVDFLRSGEGFSHVILTGPADFVFEGEITV